MKKLIFFCLSILLIIFIGNEFCYINITKSLPLGIYRTIKSPPTYGSCVVFKLPEDNPMAELAIRRGYAKEDQPFLKRVAYLEGDSYNLPETEEFDSRGRKMEPFKPSSGYVAKGMIVVRGDSSTSFDSRYFGPIYAKNIEAIVKPLLTW
ncbi:conjugative transfer signal peptidase TraF [Desulfotalea psychrophila]|uniref:Probable conjugal transfer protein TraF n=1 Tax=Desulfotalea psychrophila (strain LSv54 / DSM 12343) TaxID=177439 RepID=Q6AIF8_DESPS|nr:conjugative transfer signal peptidase TraF [Desulfotalea psychrophila]CAG37889.1 probable conjugal transfer protein TraF precursor [Desulfotalea psychrophila LSv54]